jgi:hypothetical protein
MDYFELYYAYLAWCEKDNYANYRDPGHDFMEWNHTLPQCIFGDQPIGQWLTIEQHAIASALQTLAFKTLCHCGWHKKHMPPILWKLANSCVLHEKQKVGRKNGTKCGPVVGQKLFTEKKGLFDSVYDNVRFEWARRGIENQKIQGTGIYNPIVREASREVYVENGKRTGEKSFKNKTGLFDPRNKDKIEEARKQMWVSTLDGFISTAAGVASHNRSIGGSGKDKIKLSNQ